MAQLFPKSFNSLAKISIVGGIVAVVIFVLSAAAIFRSPYLTDATVPREQPVPFSHEHHVYEVGLDCRLCHTTVEKSYFAGIPPTHTCMTCHSQLFKDSPAIKPLRDSHEAGLPLAWTRVNDLPDFVYFDHSIHVAKGVACVTCHGPVDRMPLTWRNNAQDMAWCLDCHRDPGAFVGDPASVMRLTRVAEKKSEINRDWIKELHIKERTNCSSCHH